jgi:carboxylesterase
MVAQVIPGAEAWSHVGGNAVGALVVHGFTGNPSSMREIAHLLADAGFDVELPRLAGHGTSVEEMMTTRWADWSGDADAAYKALSARCKKVVVVGLSMGGALTLWLAAQHPEIAGIVCINPAAQPVGDEMTTGIQSMIDGGLETIDSIGSDIADPNVKESSYDATPLRPALSMFSEGIAPLALRYPQIKIPMLLINSVNDHVVDPAQGTFLAEQYGGVLERVMLEQSFHVATQDLEKHIVNAKTLEFAKRVTQS